MVNPLVLVSSIVLLASSITLTTTAHAEEGQELRSLTTEPHQWFSLSVASTETIWLGGNDGVVARSTDAGQTWQYSQPGNDELQFRDIEAIDEQRAFALSVGDSGQSRIFYTTDGGQRWTQRYRASGNQFLNCFALASNGEAWVYGDTQQEHWQLVRSVDSRNWVPVRNVVSTAPQPGEGGFATGGSCIRFKNDVWAIGTGNGGTSRLLIKGLFGIRFQVIETPIISGPMAGITAVWPITQDHILFAGGDLGNSDSEPQVWRYKADEFEQLPTPPFRGAVYSLTKHGDGLLVSGPGGVAWASDVAGDWQLLSEKVTWQTACDTQGTCYAVGPEGWVGQFSL